VWSWENAEGTVRAITDDNGVVRAIDVAPSLARTARFAPLPRADLYFNQLPLDDADRAVGHQAWFTRPSQFPDTEQPAIARGYHVGNRELVLFFESQHRVLREAFFGDRDALVRLGLVPGERENRSFSAPSLTRPGGVDYAAEEQGTAYVRIAVGKDGTVNDALIYVSSGHTQLDRIAVANAMQAVFHPALLDGKPVPAVYFHREDFVHTKP
jgi:TonB family protein